MTLECIVNQLGINPDNIGPFNSNISVFHSAVGWFLFSSDPSNFHGMRCEHIHSTPSWRGSGEWHNCAFVVEDDTKPGMSGMVVVRIKLLFSFHYNGVYFPYAIVEWFDRVECDHSTGMWIVHPGFTCGKQDKYVIHLDSLLHAAHLIPVYSGNQPLPLDFHYTYSLHVFRAYFINKCIDHNVKSTASDQDEDSSDSKQTPDLGSMIQASTVRKGNVWCLVQWFLAWPKVPIEPSIIYRKRKSWRWREAILEWK